MGDSKLMPETTGPVPDLDGGAPRVFFPGAEGTRTLGVAFSLSEASNSADSAASAAFQDGFRFLAGRTLGVNVHRVPSDCRPNRFSSTCRQRGGMLVGEAVGPVWFENVTIVVRETVDASPSGMQTPHRFVDKHAARYHVIPVRRKRLH